MSKLDQIRALRESRDKRRFSKGAVVTEYVDAAELKARMSKNGLRLPAQSTPTPIAGDGVALTSTSHPVTKPAKKKGATTKRRGRPLNSERDQTLSATKPWEALGMSRRTWFRRQAEARSKPKRKAKRQ